MIDSLKKALIIIGVLIVLLSILVITLYFLRRVFRSFTNLEKKQMDEIYITQVMLGCVFVLVCLVFVLLLSRCGV